MFTLKNLAKVSIVCLFFLSLTSCSSDDDDATQSSDELYVDFSIDGEEYHLTSVLTAESNVITINANNGEGLSDSGDTSIALWLPIAVENGSFEVSDGFDAIYQVSFTSEALDFGFDFAESGTITVTNSAGDYIEGTFSATITNDNDETIVLENGEFRSYSMN